MAKTSRTLGFSWFYLWEGIFERGCGWVWFDDFFCWYDINRWLELWVLIVVLIAFLGWCFLDIIYVFLHCQLAFCCFDIAWIYLFCYFRVSLSSSPRAVLVCVFFRGGESSMFRLMYWLLRGRGDNGFCLNANGRYSNCVSCHEKAPLCPF